MYNPPRFRSDSLDEAFELMEKHPFASVITVVEAKPIISQVPLTPRRVGDRLELLGHLARANSHWRSMAKASATAIFHGAHTYVTPVWYAKDDVPTWNYLTVHASGTIELMENEGDIIDCLKSLRDHVERFWPSGWEFAIPADLQGNALSKSIVAFKIKIEEIQFKKKLSQNRSAADRAGILKGLETRSDDESRSVLFEMARLFDPDGQAK